MLLWAGPHSSSPQHLPRSVIPLNFRVPCQPCGENSALSAPLPSHHLSYHIDAILTILLFTSHSPKAVAGAILNI